MLFSYFLVISLMLFFDVILDDILVNIFDVMFHDIFDNNLV